MVKAKRKGRRLLCLVMGAAMCLVYGGAFGASGSIEVEKEWEHGNNSSENYPASVEVSLVRDGEVQDTVTLSSNNGWTGTFSNVPKYDSEGRVVTYTLSERKVEGYTSAVVQQPSAGGLNISSVSQKVTPANEDTYEIGGATFVIAKTSHSSQKEYSYCVWTETALNEDEREEFLELVNKGGLQGFGKDLTVRNTMFRNGSGAVFTLGRETVTVGGLSGNHSVTFSNTRAWALFYYGALNRIAAKRGVLSNTYTQEAIPTPDLTQTPETTKTPEVTDTPNVTNSPEATATPEVTNTPAATATPGATNTPDVTATPEVTNSPEVTATPEATNTPEATTSPETTSTPDVTSTPEATQTPAVTSTPAVTQSPAPTVTPGVTAGPTTRPTASPTAAPIIGDVDETPKSGDPSVVLWAAGAVILAAGVYYFMAHKKQE